MSKNMMKSGKGVTFIRVNGRVIPIKAKYGMTPDQRLAKHLLIVRSAETNAGILASREEAKYKQAWSHHDGQFAMGGHPKDPDSTMWYQTKYRKEGITYYREGLESALKAKKKR
jgi:hypothetical protein